MIILISRQEKRHGPKEAFSIEKCLLLRKNNAKYMIRKGKYSVRTRRFNKMNLKYKILHNNRLN